MTASFWDLISGSGSIITPDVYYLHNFPSVYFGGEVDTLSSVADGGTSGSLVYYGLDNTNVDVMRLKYYRDIAIEPVAGMAESNFYGQQRSEVAITGYRATMSVSRDMTDLLFLREFLRQADSRYSNVGGNKSLLIGHTEPAYATMPVLFTHEVSNCGDPIADQEIFALLAFEAQIWMGGISFDPVSGPSASLDISILWSPTYSGFLSTISGASVGYYLALMEP